MILSEIPDSLPTGGEKTTDIRNNPGRHQPSSRFARRNSDRRREIA